MISALSASVASSERSVSVEWGTLAVERRAAAAGPGSEPAKGDSAGRDSLPARVCNFAGHSMHESTLLPRTLPQRAAYTAMTLTLSFSTHLLNICSNYFIYCFIFT